MDTPSSNTSLAEGQYISIPVIEFERLCAQDRRADVFRRVLGIDDAANLSRERLSREMFAERRQDALRTERGSHGAIETAWAADGRERGTYYDWSARALRALVRIANHQQIWEWEHERDDKTARRPESEPER